MEHEDPSDLINYNMKELWEVSTCSSILPSTFPEEEVVEDENGDEQNFDWWVLCQVTADSIVTYYENYIHKTP